MPPRIGGLLNRQEVHHAISLPQEAVGEEPSRLAIHFTTQSASTQPRSCRSTCIGTPTTPGSSSTSSTPNGSSRKSRMSSSRSRRRTCGGSSPATTVYKQVRDALLESETIVCDGVCYQADTLTWRNHNDRHRCGKCFGYKLGPRWEGVRHEQSNPDDQAIAQIDHQGQQGEADRDRHPASPAHLALSPGHHDRSRLLLFRNSTP